MLVGFILLLILSNVDFTGTAYDTTTQRTTTTGNAMATTTMTTNLRSTVESLVETRNVNKSSLVDTSSNVSNAIVPEGRDVTCSASGCVVTCPKGTVGVIQQVMEEAWTFCDNLDLFIENCKFRNGKLSKNFFFGNYKLRNITFSNCQLSQIEDKAFSQKSVKPATTLLLINTYFSTLTISTFNGLDSLKYFKLVNKQTEVGTFQGNSFLKPMAGTLTEAVLSQQAQITVYDPMKWFTDANFHQLLHVDLSSNNFGGTLTAQTFATLLQVRELILKACGITAFYANTFDVIMATLQYLDLSGNKLMSVSDAFIMAAVSNGVQLELYDNTWSCTCHNAELINYIKGVEEKFAEDAKCTEPCELKDVYIKDLTIECLDVSTATTLKPTELSTFETTLTTSAPDLPIPETTLTTVAPTLTTKTSSSTRTPIFPTVLPPSKILIDCPGATALHGSKKQPVRLYDALFDLKSINTSTVHINVQSNKKNLMLLYFKDDVQQCMPSRSTCYQLYAITNSEFYVTNLNAHQAYTFCLAIYGDTTVSPFNCQAHYSTVYVSEEQQLAMVWLSRDHLTLFVIIVSVIVVSLILLGALCIYCLLRWRPSWLKGCKRLYRISNAAAEVLLLPKTSSSTDVQYAINEMTKERSALGIDENDLHMTSYDYMKFCKNVELSKQKRIECMKENSAPIEYAPVLPAERLYFIPSDTTTVTIEEAIDDNIYECLN